MVACKSFNKISFGRLGRSSAELRENYGRVSEQTSSCCDSLPVAAGTEMVDED